MIMPKDWLDLSWRMLVLRGGVGVCFGLLSMVWPTKTLVAMAIFWGVWALLDGVSTLLHVFGKGIPSAARFLAALIGIISVLAALVALSSPTFAVKVVTWVLGAWLLTRGIGELISAFSITQAQGKILLVISGFIDLAIGILFMSNPGRSALAMAFVLGLLALIWGLVLILSGFALRNQIHDLRERPSVP